MPSRGSAVAVTVIRASRIGRPCTSLLISLGLGAAEATAAIIATAEAPAQTIPASRVVRIIEGFSLCMAKE